MSLFISSMPAPKVGKTVDLARQEIARLRMERLRLVKKGMEQHRRPLRIRVRGKSR